MEMLVDRSSDEQIVRQVINGDIESFKIIVKRYQSFLFGIGMRFFKNEDDALDFIQDVFLKTFLDLESHRGGAFRSWLGRIAYNHGINLLKSKKIDNVVYEESVSREPDPEKTHVDKETAGVLMSAINELPEQYRICVDLYFFWRLKYDDIRGITGFPVNTIKSNVLRAKNILRDKLRGTIAEDYNEM